MPSRKKSSGVAATVLTVLVATVLVVLQQIQSHPKQGQNPPGGPAPATTTSQTDRSVDQGVRAVLDAYAHERSDVHVEIEAVVTKLLPDDDEDDAHQRFIVRLEGFDHTILISHNIDLAPRVPVGAGDRVRIKGEYEWTEQGGVIHWTHHNPNRNPRHPGGWIEHEGTRYE